MLQDILGSISWTKKVQGLRKVKRIGMKYRFVPESAEQRTITVLYTPSSTNRADSPVKTLIGKTFWLHRKYSCRFKLRLQRLWSGHVEGKIRSGLRLRHTHGRLGMCNTHSIHPGTCSILSFRNGRPYVMIIHRHGICCQTTVISPRSMWRMAASFHFTRIPHPGFAR